MPPPQYATSFYSFAAILHGSGDAEEFPASNVRYGSPWLTTELGSGGGILLVFTSSVAPAGIFVDNLGCTSLTISRLVSGSFTTAATVTPGMDWRCGRLKAWWANTGALAAQVWRLSVSGTASNAPVSAGTIGTVVVPTTISTFSAAASMGWPEPEILYPGTGTQRFDGVQEINVEGRPRVQYTIQRDGWDGSEAVYTVIAGLQAVSPSGRIFIYENRDSTSIQYAYYLEIVEDPILMRSHASLPMSGSIVLREAWT